ncbi:hypothetical protein MHK_002104 [Candidatus Magnetomorum sp. HK-1]|nr:hypothetical protein MHK_002104 [Candidatus Magnetomorum sp. HK-1]
MTSFKANCHALLIGSLPMDDHESATQMVFDYTPEIPLWVQLPKNKQEGMILQFVPGMPGLSIDGDSVYIDTKKEGFEQELVEYYEEFLAVSENSSALADSRFPLSLETGKGFYVFLDWLKKNKPSVLTLKGQVTGPITLGIGVNDQDGRSLFYDDTLRDVVAKHVAMNAKWQVTQLAPFSPNPPIVFFDEPGVVSFGSSAYISISREQVMDALGCGIDAIHEVNGLAGIHICANGDWSLALESQADIISFDAYSYFDNFILFKDAVRNFLSAGRILAWGIVPTSRPEDIEKESTDSLLKLWESQVEQLVNLGFSKQKIMEQSLITPSCGTGSLTLDHAKKVLTMTKDLSLKLRERIN